MPERLGAVFGGELLNKRKNRGRWTALKKYLLYGQMIDYSDFKG